MSSTLCLFGFFLEQPNQKMFILLFSQIFIWNGWLLYLCCDDIKSKRQQKKLLCIYIGSMKFWQGYYYTVHSRDTSFQILLKNQIKNTLKNSFGPCNYLAKGLGSRSLFYKKHWHGQCFRITLKIDRSSNPHTVTVVQSSLFGPFCLICWSVINMQVVKDIEMSLAS